MLKRSVFLLTAGWVLSSAVAYAQGDSGKPPAKIPAAAKPPEAKPPAPAPGAKPPAEKPAPPPEEAATEEEATEPPPPPPPPEPEPTPAQPPTTGKGPSAGGINPVPGGFGPMPMWPQPSTDAAALQKQDQHKKAAAKKDKSADEIYAEDWWSHARPIFEIHGYFRVRAELFHNFSLGRVDSPSQALWPMPADNHYTAQQKTFGPDLCTGKESPESNLDSDDPRQGLFPCKNKTQAGANLRFRLNPELHISDNLRVMSQIDLLDNLVLGSTPEGYANSPAASGGYAVEKRAGTTPLGAFDSSQSPPSAGQNSFRDSVRVKRVWAEYMTPVGQLRFGRMPSHWGLGILANSGDGPDDDYQTTTDRIMFVTGIKSLDVYFAGAWDFPNEGATSESLSQPQAQPYDLGQLDDVDEYVFVAMRKKSPELTKLALAQGNLVLNGGMYLVHRRQLIANDTPGDCAAGAAALGCSQEGFRYARRGAVAWIPDLWVQALYKKFRFELEAVTVQGSIESAPGAEVNGYKLRMWGVAGEVEQKLVEDKLRLELKSGWASGDPDVAGPLAGGLSPGFNGLQAQRGDNTISTFRFHPNYKVDLILNRNILNRIQGTYYFRPSVEYDFVREPNGQRFGGGFAGIWTRASEFMQTPGHKRDLGIELDFSLYFQSKDGALNDFHEKPGGFYTMLQYGVLFPMAGLGYQEREAVLVQQAVGAGATETSTAQILRWYLGVLF
jgi:uncharacterized protein (TIGR04551 family)